MKARKKYVGFAKKWKIPIESVTDKMIMSIYGLKIPYSQIQIYYTKYMTLAESTITLDGVFQNYFKKSSDSMKILYVRIIPLSNIKLGQHPPS